MSCSPRHLPDSPQRLTWSLRTMMLLVAWISGVLATIHYLSWITIFFTPVWLGVLGILISEDRLSGFVRGYVVGMLLILGTMIVGGVVVGLLGHFGEW